MRLIPLRDVIGIASERPITCALRWVTYQLLTLEAVKQQLPVGNIAVHLLFCPLNHQHASYNVLYDRLSAQYANDCANWRVLDC